MSSDTNKGPGARATSYAFVLLVAALCTASLSCKCEPPASTPVKVLPPDTAAAVKVYRGPLMLAIPGLHCPHVYGLDDWSGLEHRTLRNLSTQLLDLARVRLRQGRPVKAKAAVKEALSLVLANSRESATAQDLQPKNRSATFHAPESAGKPLAERLRKALESGWFGAAALAYFRLFPGPDGKVWTPAMFKASANKLPLGARGVWWLQAARHLKERNDAAGSARAARLAGALISVAVEKLLSTREMDGFPELNSMVYLGGDPRARVFPWGWLSGDFALTRLEGYLGEAATLASAREPANHAALRARVRALIKKRRASQGPPARTTAKILLQVPTCDSSSDLLGQAGLVLDEAVEQHAPARNGLAKITKQTAKKINAALAAADRPGVARAADALLDDHRARLGVDRPVAEQGIKKVRNEMVRLYMING